MAVDLSRFPDDVLKPSANYIYFMSLQGSEAGDYILSCIEPHFSTGLSSSLIKGKTGTQSIDDAFSFLDAVIAAEYSKEKNFLEYLKTHTKNIQKFNPPSLTEDWNSFIKEIQENLGAGEHAIQAMENELLRLQRQNERRGDKKNITGAYEQDQISKLTDYADMLNKFINNNNQQADSKILSRKIYGMVLSKFGSKLINMDSKGQLIFNRSQLLGLMNTISSIILHDYVIKNSLDSDNKYKQFNEKYSDFDLDKLKQIMNSSEIEKRVDSIINNATALPFLTDDMAENLGLIKATNDESFDNEQLSQLSNLIRDTTSYGTKLEQIGNLFHNLYDDYTIPESAFKITSTGNIYSEVVSTMNALGRNASGAFNTGGAGAKPDNILGFITIDIDELLALKAKDQKKYEGAVKEFENIHTELKKLSGGFKATNTDKYYKQQEQQWNISMNNIRKSLQNLKETYKLLGNCYIIEDSTKNYISLYGKTINNQLSDSMHGGSLGPNVQDQITKISNLANIGGISFPDAKWLISVIINSGPNMVANEQKNQLEDYLAAFATILLFDDQINIVKEAYKKIKIKQAGNVEKIHLFSVNDGYYPLSFVLQKTKEALTVNYENAQAYIKNNPSGGAKIEINGYVKEPIEAYKKRKAINQWDATRQAALAETKLSITFLVGFMGVLQKLFPDIK